MADEGGVDSRVLAANTLQCPEEERLGELTRGVVHAGGDVKNKNDRRLSQRLRTPPQLPKAQIVVGKGDRVRLNRAALHRFLDCSAAIQSGAWTTAIDAFAHVLRLVNAVGGFWLEIGEFQLFPQPVENFIDFELQNEFDTAFSGARTTVATAAGGGAWKY